MKRILSIALVMLLLLVGLVGCGTQEPQTPQTPQEEITAVSATKTAVRVDSGQYYVYSIVGNVTNNTDEYISQVIVTITVYDDVDVAMKKLSATISGLEGKQTKEYSCLYKVYKSQGRVPSKSEITDVTYN